MIAQRLVALKSNQSGQTLVMLLAFMATAVIVTSTAAAVTITNITANSQYTYGQRAYQIAQSGVDNALLRLLRDPNYTGETVTVGQGTVTISVSGSSTKTITAVGTSGDFTRTIVATAEQSNNTLNLTSWEEQP